METENRKSFSNSLRHLQIFMCVLGGEKYSKMLGQGWLMSCPLSTALGREMIIRLNKHRVLSVLYNLRKHAKLRVGINCQLICQWEICNHRNFQVALFWVSTGKCRSYFYHLHLIQNCVSVMVHKLRKKSFDQMCFWCQESSQQSRSPGYFN